MLMVRFGIVGTGRISDWVLKGAVQDPRFRAVAVCSRKEETGRKFVEEHPEAFGGDALVFTSLEEMCASPMVDAVYIGTPNMTHCNYTLTALNAGKHVLCEKPLACSSAEAEAMVEASLRNGRCLMEAMISTLNPNFRAAREKMGEIGRVWHFSASFCQYSSKYDALKKGIVSNSFNPLSGGGALADIGIYTTYPAVALFGRPAGVRADVLRFPTGFGDTDVHGAIELSYPGMTATLTYSKVVDSHLPTEICGEGGNILLDAVHICRKTEFSAHQAPNSGRGPAASVTVLSEGLPKDEYFYEFEEFINVIESGGIESSVNSHGVSLANREVMDKILEIANE